MISIEPSATARRPFSASGSIRTNHCLLTIGSITSPPRCDRGTRVSYDSVPMARPPDSRSAQTRSLASRRSSAAYRAVACSFMVPSRFMMLMIGRPCRLPSS